MQSTWYGKEHIVPKQDRQYEKEKGYRATEGIVLKQGKRYCGRCFKKVSVCLPCERCGKACYYCHSCIDMGKVSECCQLVYKSEPDCQPKKVTFSWKGTLSCEQANIAQKIRQTIQKYDRLLVSAVTGSGKTEMLFQGIHFALEMGYRICVAAPRIDVCLELAPRLQAVFPDEDCIVLYGQMKEAYRYTKLVIATTHQLLKFRCAFDVLIIDEVDSFPFQNNMSLQQRIQHVVKPLHSLIYLTATPTLEHRQAIKKGELSMADLPARYHRHALPVPQFYYIGDWRSSIQKGKRHNKCIRFIQQQLQTQKHFLVFLPHIALMIALEEQLRHILPDTIRFTSVSAKDALRVDKVLAMRQKDYDFILTTTILERGVTFSNIDVIVIGSEDGVYTTASLVQIAGRVGRKQDYPTGNVYFLHNGCSKAMIESKKWIVMMNKQARERGLIDE